MEILINYRCINTLNKETKTNKTPTKPIKSDKNKQYYVYPLNKTPLNYILDKKFILNLIKSSEGRLIDEKYYNFSIEDKGRVINIFFLR